jgi:hypothetical protein
MTTERPQRSATIYQFPARGRKNAAAHRVESDAAAETPSPRVPANSVGGAWYHEAAIQDSRRAGER